MRSIAEQFQEWCPESRAFIKQPPVPSLSDAHAYCRVLATGHYENFPVVSWLLPPRLHQHFYNVYAFCRWSDDLGDELGDRELSTRALHWWREELNACLNGETRHPVFVALLGTIQQFQIPPQPFHDLITAFEQDQVVTSYNTFEELRGYCRCSADPVGRIVLYLCEQFNAQNAEWSDSICTGLQLANFWQDVDRDLDIGRIYLPLEDCVRFGYSFDELRARQSTPAFLRLMEFEVDRARSLLRSGLPLVEQMPGRLQIDIDLFARGGLCILDRITAIGYRVLDQRPVVRKWDIIGLLIRAICRQLVRSMHRR